MTNPHQNPFGHNPFDQSAPPGVGPAPPYSQAQQPPGSAGGEPNTLATLSLIFAFVFAPAGAILGHLGLSQITRTRQRGRERALIGVTLSYAFITTSVVALVVSAALSNNGTGTPSKPSASTATTAPSTATTTTPPPTVAPADLTGLLPTVEDTGRITSNQNLQVTDTHTRIDPDVGVVDPEKCWSANFAASAHAYDTSAITGVSGTDVRDQTNPGLDPFGVTEFVTAFHDARTAQRQRDTLTGQWRQCAGETVHRTNTKGVHTAFFFGQPITEANGITTIEYRQTELPSGGPTLLVVRAVAARANVVVDVLMGSCRAAGSQHDAALALTTFILDKIPGPR